MSIHVDNSAVLRETMRGAALSDDERRVLITGLASDDACVRQMAG